MIHSSRVVVVASVFLSHPLAATQVLSDMLWRAGITVFLLELVPAQILFLINCGALFSKVTTFLTDVNENCVSYTCRPCDLLLWISFSFSIWSLFSVPRFPFVLLCWVPLIKAQAWVYNVSCHLLSADNVPCFAWFPLPPWATGRLNVSNPTSNPGNKDQERGRARNQKEIHTGGNNGQIQLWGVCCGRSITGLQDISLLTLITIFMTKIICAHS